MLIFLIGNGQSGDIPVQKAPVCTIQTSAKITSLTYIQEELKKI
jgi:hypothetical protein